MPGACKTSVGRGVEDDDYRSNRADIVTRSTGLPNMYILHTSESVFLLSLLLLLLCSMLSSRVRIYRKNGKAIENIIVKIQKKRSGHDDGLGMRVQR